MTTPQHIVMSMMIMTFIFKVINVKVNKYLFWTVLIIAGLLGGTPDLLRLIDGTWNGLYHWAHYTLELLLVPFWNLAIALDYITHYQSEPYGWKPIAYLIEIFLWVVELLILFKWHKEFIMKYLKHQGWDYLFKKVILRTKFTVLESDIDFVQFTLSCLYGYISLTFLNFYFGAIRGYPLEFQLTYISLTSFLHPLVPGLFFFILWVFMSWDGLNLYRKSRHLKHFYLIGPFLWLYISVGIFLDFGFIVSVGVYLYLFAHSTWIYLRY